MMKLSFAGGHGTNVGGQTKSGGGGDVEMICKRYGVQAPAA